MYKFFLIFLLLGSFQTFAQQDEIEIQINQTDSLKEKIPFYIKDITLNTENQEKLGLVCNQRAQNIYSAVLEKKFEQRLSKMLSNRFVQRENNLPIRLAITKLSIYNKDSKACNPNDSLIFGCSFISQHEKIDDTLFVFRAKNAMGQFDNAKQVTENYLHRAILSAIHQFSKAVQTHPEWNRLKDEKDFKLIANVFHNKISSVDSMPCILHLKLTLQDFQFNTKKDSSQQEGLCRLVLTYQANSEETNKGIQLVIHTKAFFDKQRSWRKSSNNDTTWLNYQQGHFDLCTFYGYKMRDSMKIHPYSIGEFKTELNKIYNYFYQQYTDDRKQFQDETNYGKSFAYLMQWQQKIQQWLLLYKAEH